MSEKTFTLECSKTVDGKLKCKKVETKEEIELNYENVVDPYFLFEKEMKNGKNTNSSIVISTVIFASLIGGFSFGVAYFTMYMLYDYTTHYGYPYEISRIIISFAILIALLFACVTVTYFILKRANQENVKMYEQMFKKKNITPETKKQ